jgi:hypothetical protein
MESIIISIANFKENALESRLKSIIFVMNFIDQYFEMFVGC